MVFWARCVKGILSESRPELDIFRRCFSARLLLLRGVGIPDENNRDHPAVPRTTPTSMPEMKVEGDHIPGLRLTDVGWNIRDIVHRFAYIPVNFIMKGSPMRTRNEP
jgi:hypothetical protein